MSEVSYSISRSTLIEWKRKLQAIKKPVVPYSSDRVEMAEEVIKQSMDLASSILIDINSYVRSE